MFKLPAKIERLLELDPSTLSVRTREGKHCEFKRDFIANDLSDYAKTLAAFANADGGILVFGIAERPARIVGISTIPDEAEWANRLREDFAPEIVVATRAYSIGHLKLLVVGLDRSENRPVMCRKSRSKLVHNKEGKARDVEILREGLIYYRYAGQTRPINHSEFAAILLDREQQRIHGFLQTLKTMDPKELKKISILRTGRKHSENRSTSSARQAAPPAPGRLNDLRHIIYKKFGEQVSASLHGLGLMMRESLLKENIDGEALLWAYSRLVQERARKKILFMFTDGEPMDDSTLSVQKGDFLRQHFRSVVKRIVSERKVMLKLIGINHDLSNVLFDAVRASESTLGDPVLKTIGNVLNPA